MEKTAKKRMIKWALLLAAAVVLLPLLIMLTLDAYFNETAGRISFYFEDEPENENYVEVWANIVQVDLNRSEAKVRLFFVPRGSLADGQRILGQKLILYARVGNDLEQVFPRGSFMAPFEVTVDTDGEVSVYPWDEHEGKLEFYLAREGEGGEVEGVPMQLAIAGSVEGISLKVEVDKFYDGSFAVVTIDAARSTLTKMVVYFAIVILWTLAFIVMVMAVLVMRGRRLEMVMFPFAGTILFSMVAFRNALPGAPPIGAISDYLGFFWGYALVTLSLVAFTVTWARRRD